MFKKLKNNMKSYFSNGPKVAFIAILMVTCSVITVNSLKKTVTVSINGKDMKIVTYKNTLADVLSANEITVGPKDKITPSFNNKIKDGEKISIKKAVNVELAIDGKLVDIKTAEDDVAKMLSTEGIAIADVDKVYPSKETMLKEGLRVIVTRVESKLIRESQPVDFATLVKKNDNMEQGTQTIVQEGQLGERVVSTRVIYENGKEVSRYVVKDTIAKKPIQKILSIGTLGVIRPSRGGKAYYTKSLTMRATAYTAGYESTGKVPGDSGYGITASGTTVRRNPDGYSTIAVDPRVIPIGTRLYVDGYGYAVAEDTGGAIKGNRIDVYFNSNGDARHWGVKWVKVYVLK